MEKKRRKRKIRISQKISVAPLSAEVSRGIEELLAKLMADAYRTDNPDLFGLQNQIDEKSQHESGLAAAAAEVTGAPPVNAAGPDHHMELENEEKQHKGSG